MTPISIEQYLGRYKDHPDVTPERMANAVHWLACTNLLLAEAEEDGVELMENPDTGSLIAGEGNGGFRPHDCPIGAPGSAHKEGKGGDIFDPERTLASWSLRNEEWLMDAGIAAMENPRWTPTWCHWQTRALASGNFVFIPSAAAPLAAALPEQALV